MTRDMVPFNVPHMTGDEQRLIGDAHRRGHLSGDGHYTTACHRHLERLTATRRALLTHSCTAALEMAALLADIQPGDEIILPSYTFVSTANAFVLRGAVPVFVDIRADTLNIDEELIEAAITERTRAIVPVHYAGVSCEMDRITSIAAKHGLLVVEDAAQAIMSTYRGRSPGAIGDLGTFSFHETKNVISGEGGALLINRSDLVERAEIIREKGTNRSQFFRGMVDRYTWVDVGSSFLPGEIVAAFLFAQLGRAAEITRARLNIWNRYHEELEVAEGKQLLRRPVIPEHCQHNAHMYYVILAEGVDRGNVIDYLAERGVQAVFHYVPLHESPMGAAWAERAGRLPNTEDLSRRLLRLPLWMGVEQHQELVVETLLDAIVAGA